MPKQTIEILGPTGKRVAVEADVKGDWAVHKEIQMDGGTLKYPRWVLTHVPSGCQARAVDCKRRIAAIREQILAAGLDASRLRMIKKKKNWVPDDPDGVLPKLWQVMNSEERK